MDLMELIKRQKSGRLTHPEEAGISKQSKKVITASLLSLMIMFAYMPTSHAFGGYGDSVDAECFIANGTKPYSGNCSLCHASESKSIPVEPEWSAFHAIGPLAFCDQAPDSIITSPSGSLTVDLGDSANFVGTGTATAPDPEADLPLTFNWDFGGAATNSTDQNPTVTFSNAGTFTISFAATDSKGRSDPTPATINLTVVDPNPNQAPNGTIDTPASNVSINVGDSISFSGTGNDPDGDNTLLSYFWNFGGGATNTDVQNPMVTFNTSGIYTVTFTVTDGQGLSDPTPATRTVTVGALKAACSDQDNDLYSPEGGVCGPIDCDDFDAAVNPGAIEACGDHVDNDCNGNTDQMDAHCKGGANCPADLLKRVEIIKASWDRKDRELSIKGYWSKAGEPVTLSDALTGEILGSTRVKGREHDEDHEEHDKKTSEINYVWKFELEYPATVPCRVRAEIDGRFGERDVAYAPADCSGKPPVSNNPPVANDDNATTASAQKVKIDVLNNDTDLDEDRLRIIVFTQAEHGTVTKDDDRLVYKPKGKFEGSDEFTYTISDGHGGTDSATVSVTVQRRIKRDDDD